MTHDQHDADDHADHNTGHQQTHGHAHGHNHAHGPADYGRAFAIGVALNLSFVLVEAVFGVIGHSLALLADAGHNLSDVLAMLMAWGATALARRPPSVRFTYGLRSSSILAALANAVFLLVVTGGIAWEAIQRLLQPAPVDSGIVIGVAAFGVLINTGTALLFMAGRKGDLNIRAAFLHMASDAVVSLGVVIAGIVMLFTHWFWLDSTVSLFISAVIVIATWGILRDSTQLALHGVPEGIETQAVRAYLAALPNVAAVHDLHIWAMSTTETALTAHLVMPNGYPGDALLNQIGDELQIRFHIDHPTLQVETGDPAHPCALAPDHRI
ncbi:cation diffusion facilitator family transporter [Acidithiobacillus ferrivorans]|uniref:Cation transporter n=1 Tax=Acidithiobacillus ferrivorans TaxID=160808 RepID=A0A7T5BGK5_9PROT|nr:cation diffusion facilitator family transporter [Acidithiobacillus ferrivorans]QQD71663.1 cation transporter [Acidithiobacillus ferrivorans]